MNSHSIRFVIFSLLVLVLQVWVLGSFSLFRVAIPLVYPLLLMLLPIGTSQIGMSLIGFAIGSILDILYQTPGLHASALTTIAFGRKYILTLLIDRDTITTEPPLYYHIGSSSVFLWTVLLLMHHILLYLLSALGGFHWNTLLVNAGAGFVVSFFFGWILYTLISLNYSSSGHS